LIYSGYDEKIKVSGYKSLVMLMSMGSKKCQERSWKVKESNVILIWNGIEIMLVFGALQ